MRGDDEKDEGSEDGQELREEDVTRADGLDDRVSEEELPGDE